ncbi:tyrosine protein kinase-like, putative [Bodo saltans]|uniref:Tyrosine protein kinase-like, putative n=1 Tax=Bodo saltans TaxID=75058 RepID=A0A0S4IYN8_BODSA|nr:tyrosine protein kinase-like, putative [Bodo saltans]|eukprot:CUG57438.1 tyrosine protein kinase-like, putative [Bodo saltans]
MTASSRDFAGIIQAHLDTFFNDVDELMASTATATPPVTAGKSMKGSNSPSAVLRQLQHQQQPHLSPSAGGPAVFKYDSGSIVSFVAASGMSSVLFPQGSLRYNGSVGSGRAGSGSAAAAAAASAAAAMMGDSAPSAAEVQQQCHANDHHGNMLTNTDVSHFAPVTRGGATGDAFAALGSDWEVVHRQHQLMRLGSSGIQTTSTTTGAASTSFQHTTSMLLGSSGSTMAGLRSPAAVDGTIATAFQQIPSMAQLIGSAATATPPHTLMQRLPEETAVDSSVPLHQVLLTRAVPSNQQQQHLFTPTPRRSNVAVDRRPSPHITTITLPSHPSEEAAISSPQSAASAPSPHFLMNDSHSNSNSADHHLQPPHQRSPLTKDQQSSTSGRNSSSATTASAATAASLLLLISDLRATLAPLFPTSAFAHRGSLPQSATTISSFDQRGRRTASGSSETVLNFSGRDGVVGGGVLNSSIGAGGFVVPLLHQRSSIESTAASVIFQQQQQQQPNFQELRLPFQYRQSFSSISQNGTAAAAAAAAGGSPRVSPRQAFVGVPRPPPPPSAVYFMRLTQLPSDSQDTRNNENSVPSLSPHAEILLQQQQQQQQQQHYLNANLNAAAAELSVNSGSNQPQHHHDEGAAGNSAPNQTPLSQGLENEFVSGDDAVGGEPHNSRPRSPRMTSPAGGPAAELLISVAHPGVAASSLLVSFGWDSDVTHRLEDDDDEDAEEDEEDGDDDIGDDEEIDSLHNNESSKPFDGASMAAMPTAARAILEPRPPHQQSPAMANRKLHDAYNTTTTTIIPAPPPPPPSLFSLTPIISNNYVLLGGLGKCRWKWERPIVEHRRHHQHPSIDPSTEGIHNKSPGATRCITMREDVLLAFSLKEKEVVVVKMLSPLSSLASVAPAHRVQETSGGVPLPLNSPQGSEDASAGAPPNTMGSNVVATGRALRQARIASGVAELKKLASLRHPNLVTLIDVLVDATAGCFYLVQEHCDAGTISDYFTTTVSLLQRRTTRDAFDDDDDSSPLSHQEEEKGHNHHHDHNHDIRVYPAIAKCLVHVLRGLLYLHQHGIAHRSIALGTILVTYNGVARLSGAALPPECSRHSAALQKTNASAPIHCRDGSPFFESTSAELFSKDIAAVGQTFASLMPEEDEERTAAYLRRFSGTLGPDEGASRMAPPAVLVMLGKGEQLITSPTPTTTHDDIRSQLQLLALLQEMSNGGLDDDGSAVGTAELRTPEMKDPTLLVASFLKRAEELAKRF